MKSIIGMFAILLISTASFAHTSENTEPELKVMAKSGLKLRLSPNTDAPVLTIVNYGESLIKSDDFVSSKIPFKVNWVEGQWIKVKYGNHVGFVFDGFVSKLNAPIEYQEFTSSVDEIGFAMYHWAFNNYEFLGADTLSQNERSTLIKNNLAGNELLIYSADEYSSFELTLEDIRIMDAYHLLESMMDTRSARSMLKENSIFFENGAGKVNKIKISNGQVTISQDNDGSIKIKCVVYNEGC